MLIGSHWKSYREVDLAALPFQIARLILIRLASGLDSRTTVMIKE
jgi:hypothetical protein